ncbi:hypothetical protein P9273_18715 [Mesorhizobium sp. WSM4935]|uniref:hypothetical protein n=1 Tax=Mesorhizobium sp. WSM4935 TaxID=3038547 RepID=UPI002414DBFB|nr:hypothetical protein [Mesorhizobium sp. WSM4935]MDG4877132.1 hypothetical protein [Mesorhizobium sp. WSM4935]
MIGAIITSFFAAGSVDDSTAFAATAGDSFRQQLQAIDIPDTTIGFFRFRSASQPAT